MKHVAHPIADGPVLRATSWDEGLFRVAFSILLVTALAPIWLTPCAPLPDDAAHLASASVWTHLGDPRYRLGNYYALSLGLTPYWGYYLLVRVLAVPIGLVHANQLVLSLYVLGMAFGIVRLLDRFEHSRWMALGVFALLWTFSFNLGFIHCCLSFALVPWALAAFDAFCETPSVRRGASSVLLGLAIYFNHVLGWGLFLGAGGLIGLMHRGRSVRQLAARAVVWALVLAGGVLASLYGRGKGMGAGVRHHKFSAPNTMRELAHLFADNVWNLCARHEAQ